MVKGNQRFERAAVSREEALSMFQENKFKVRAGLNPYAGINGRCAILVKGSPTPVGDALGIGFYT